MLPPETEKVWNFLRQQPSLAGFVLIGGSALALRLGHRLSEDLDFAFPQTQLPRSRLQACLRLATEAHFTFEPSDDEAALTEFANGGLELHDYQQDYLVNRAVKVSFFAPEAPLAKIIGSGAPAATVRMASLAELFRAKCLVSALRSKTRDWLDLYLLLRNHGFSISDYRKAFQEAGIESQCDMGLSRLCSGTPQKDDEGYTHLLAHPPSLEAMKTFFIAQRDELEIKIAAESARQHKAS